MKVKLVEVNDVEGAWVESDAATYSVAYEDELQELAMHFGIDPSWQEDALVFLAGKVGESAEAPGFLIEAERNPVL